MEALIKLSDDELREAIQLYVEKKGYLVKRLQYGDKKPDISLSHVEHDHAKGVFYYSAKVEIEKI